MLKIAIIDDQKNTLTEIQTICNDYFNNINYLCKIDTFLSSHTFLNHHEVYDIVFLDIEIYDMNGLELAEIIRRNDKDCCICFVSNYGKYALKSFHVHAFDFIEKPLKKAQLINTLDEMFAYYGSKLINKTKILLNNNIALFINDIIYFEYIDKSDEYVNRSVVVHTFYNNYAFKQKISSVLKMLPIGMFGIPHKSFIVNFQNISFIHELEIIMKNKNQVPLSQKRATKFKREFNDYLKKFIIG